MEKFIYLITNEQGIKTAHSSVLSLLEHPDGLQISSHHFYQLSKKKFPFTYKGKQVERVQLFSTKESRKLDIENRIL